MSLLSGPKFNARHQTFLPSSGCLLSELKSLESVKKIFLGEIKSSSPTNETNVKITSIQGNLIKIAYRGRNAIQIFRILTTQNKETENLLEKYVNKKKKKKPKFRKKTTLNKGQREQSWKVNQKWKSTGDTICTLGDIFPELNNLKEKL